MEKEPKRVSKEKLSGKEFGEMDMKLLERGNANLKMKIITGIMKENW